jgi:hypothetical protein
VSETICSDSTSFATKPCALRRKVSQVCRFSRSLAPKAHLVVDSAAQESRSGKVTGPSRDQGDIDRSTVHYEFRLVDESVHERQEPRAAGIEAATQRSEQVVVPDPLVGVRKVFSAAEKIPLERVGDVVCVAVAAGGMGCMNKETILGTR